MMYASGIQFNRLLFVIVTKPNIVENHSKWPLLDTCNRNEPNSFSAPNIFPAYISVLEVRCKLERKGRQFNSNSDTINDTLKFELTNTAFCAKHQR